MCERTRRNGQGIDDAPPTLQARRNDAAIGVVMGYPICQRSRSSVNGFVSICPSVVGLLLNCCPTAISRLVVPVVVRKAIKRMAYWRVAHIGEKHLEIHPSTTDSDPSRSIFIVIFVLRICAALHHFGPYFIDPGLGHAVPIFPAPTAARSASFCDVAEDSAFAECIPASLPSVPAGQPKHTENAEFEARYVSNSRSSGDWSKWRKRFVNIQYRHRVNSLTKMFRGPQAYQRLAASTIGV